MSAPTEDDLSRAGRAREAALLLRFLAGVLLATQEMAELRGVLPAEVLANPPEPSPEYAHPYSYYAAELSCGERNIKRLVAVGKPSVRGQPADFPPFDEPGKFLAWWDRRMGKEPGPHVRAFAAMAPEVPPAAETKTAEVAAGSPATAPPAASSADGSPSPPALPPPAAPLSFEFSGVGGFEESVRELRATVAAAQNRLRRAMSATPIDEGLVRSCTKAVQEQMDLLRKSENDLFAFQQKRGELVPRSEIREDWRTLLSALRRMRERMETNVESALAKSAAFTPDQVALVKSCVGAERAREDQLLRTSKFWRQETHVSTDPLS